MTPQNESRLISILEKLDRTVERIVDVVQLQTMVIRHDVRIAELERRLADAEEDVENTGSIILDDVKKKVTEYEGDKKYWVRYVVIAIIGVIMLAISTTLGYLARR